MFLALLNNITNHYKTVITSITGAVVTMEAPISSLQIVGAYVAIIAGAMTIVNMVFPLRSFYDKYKANHEKQNIQ